MQLQFTLWLFTVAWSVTRAEALTQCALYPGCYTATIPSPFARDVCVLPGLRRVADGGDHSSPTSGGRSRAAGPLPSEAVVG